MKIRKNLKSQLIITIFVMIFAIILRIYGCLPESSTITSEPRDTLTFLEVTSVVPDSLPYSGGPFSITVRGWFKQWATSINAHLTFYKYYSDPNPDSCYGFDTNLVLHEHEDLTINLNTNRFSSNYCNPQQGVYVVKIFTSNLSYYQHYYNGLGWGTAVLPLYTINVGRYKMYSSDLEDCDSAINCSMNSFNKSDVRINPVFSSNNNVSDNEFPNISSPSQFIHVCDSFAYAHRFINLDTFRVFHALNHSFTPSIVGASEWTGDQGALINWTYVFMDRVEEQIQGSGLNLQSCINATTVHELMHQLGKYDNNEHTNHTNPNADSCAFWYLSHLDSLDWLDEYDGYFRMCKRHVDGIRNILRPPEFVLGNSGEKSVILNYPMDGFNQKYDLIMTIPKNTLKEFEPIIATFNLINLDDKPLNIYGIFTTYLNEGNFIIKDNLGNMWTNNKIGGSISVIYKGPNYIINPYDTLIVSMPINSWAEKIKTKNYKEHYFDQSGYFPAGRSYAVYFDNGEFKSNEVHFDVLDLEQEDKNFLEEYKKNIYNQPEDDIINKFQGNVFIEYASAENLVFKYWKTIGEIGVLENVKDSYEKFFKDYPNTNYIFNDQFMAPYIISLFPDEDYSLINVLKNENVCLQISDYWNSKNIINRIESIKRQFQRKKKIK